MKSGFFIALLLVANFAWAQFRPAPETANPAKVPFPEIDAMKGEQQPIFAGLKSDPVSNFQYASPWYTFWPGNSGQLYWLGSTTTQSFNQGKFGTIYFYDVQGNLRYASPFIDISGKKKRGLKLLLPTVTQRMFTPH